MRIEERVSGDVHVLKLAGEFDRPQALEVAEGLDAAMFAGASRLVVNLRRVRFAGAAALGCLVRARANVRGREGDLVVSAPSRFVRTVLRALEPEHRFLVFPDDDAAVRHFRNTGKGRERAWGTLPLGA